MKLKKTIKILGKLTCIGLILSLCACKGQDPKSIAVSADSVTVGVAYPVAIQSSVTLFDEGLELAKTVINEQGGINNRRLELSIRDDENDVTKAVQIAQSFVNSGIHAVIGHFSTDISYVTEDVYEDNQIIMINPVSSGRKLYEYSYQYVFRIIAEDGVFAQKIAEYAKQNGIDNLAIYYSDDVYGNSFSKLMEKTLSEYDITVLDRFCDSGFASKLQLERKLAALGCEGVVIASNSSESVEKLLLIKSINPDLHIFGNDAMDFNNLIELIGNQSNIHIASYNPKLLDETFFNRFVSEYGTEPDIFAITAYESLMLYSDAARATGVFDSNAISDYLRSLEDYQSVYSKLSFNEKTNEFDGKNVYVKTYNASVGAWE